MRSTGSTYILYNTRTVLCRRPPELLYEAAVDFSLLCTRLCDPRASLVSPGILMTQEARSDDKSVPSIARPGFHLPRPTVGSRDRARRRTTCAVLASHYTTARGQKEARMG